MEITEKEVVKLLKRYREKANLTGVNSYFFRASVTMFCNIQSYANKENKQKWLKLQRKIEGFTGDIIMCDNEAIHNHLKDMQSKNKIKIIATDIATGKKTVYESLKEASNKSNISPLQIKLAIKNKEVKNNLIWKYHEKAH